jgi:DnaK suppressor protein
MANKKTTKISAKTKKVEKKHAKPPKTLSKRKMVKTAKTLSKKKRNLSPREKKLLGIRKKLLNQRDLILAEAEEALNSLPGQTVFPDLGDQATAETDRNFMLRLRSREQKLLKKIEDAIDRIDNGTFGICDDCGMEIDIRRLEARPVTTLCIDCKTQQEEEERLRET